MLPQKFKTGHVTYLPPFHGCFVVHRLGLATVNVYTKFEVSVFTHYEDIIAIFFKLDARFLLKSALRGLSAMSEHLVANCYIPFTLLYFTNQCDN